VIVVVIENELFFGIPIEVYGVGCHDVLMLCQCGKLFGIWGQVIVQVEAFEKAFTHILGQILFFEGNMDEIDRPPGGVQNDAAVIASCKVLFKFPAKFRAEVAVDIGGQRSEQLFAI
jgi:hypothetical protein